MIKYRCKRKGIKEDSATLFLLKGAYVLTQCFAGMQNLVRENRGRYICSKF